LLHEPENFYKQAHHTPMIDELAKDIHKLFVSVFDTFTEDEKVGVTNSLTHGNGFVLFAWNASGNARILIGVVLFSVDFDSIWIN